VVAAGANAARDEARIAGCVGGDAVIGAELVVVVVGTVEGGVSVDVIVLAVPDAGADVTTEDGTAVAANVGCVVDVVSGLWDVVTADGEGLAATGVLVSGTSLLGVAAKAGVTVVIVIRRLSASDRRVRDPKGICII